MRLIIRTIINRAAALCAAALLICSCSRESELYIESEGTSNEELIERSFIVAPLESKTTVSGANVYWSEGDIIGIIDDANPAICRPFVAAEDGASVTFNGKVSVFATKFLAVYPYDPTAYGDFSNLTITTQLSAEQQLKPGEGSALLMCGKVENDLLVFHHASGIVSMTLKASDNISRILFRGNNGETVAGSASITVSSNTAAVSSINGSYTLSAVPAEGDTFASGTYYLSVAPGTFSSGFTVHLFRYSDHKEAQGSVDEEKVFSCGTGFNLGTISPASEKWKTSVLKSQTDVYVSPDGVGDATGIDEANSMPFTDFERIMNYGNGATGPGSYSLYQYKSELIDGKTYHLAAGTYRPAKTISTYCDFGEGGIAFSITGAGKGSTIIDGSSCPGYGAMCISSNSEPIIQGISFCNFSAANGGAISVEGSVAKIRDCVFSNNSASEGGGAIYNNEGTLFLSSSAFRDNSSIGQGNDILTIGEDSGFAGIHNCTFISKDGSSGADVQGSSAIALTNSTFYSGNAVASHHCILSDATAEHKVVLAGNIVVDVAGEGIGYSEGKKITSAGYNIYNHGNFTTEIGSDQTTPPVLAISLDNTYYTWNGVTDFDKPLLDELEFAISRVSVDASVKPDNTIDTYLTWLREDAGLGKDIRGINRTALLWPGSYQDGSETSTLNGTTLIPENNIYGMIVNKTTGMGIPGVPVSDGFQFVVTDENGVYQFKASKGARRVYYTLPSGYEVTLDSEFKRPKFFNDCEIEDKTSYRKDFILTPADWDQSKFTLLVMADPQVRNDYELNRLNTETMPDVMSTVNSKQAAGEFEHIYAQTLGDITFDSINLWERFRSSTTNLLLDNGGYLGFFQMMGNHDHNGLAKNDPHGMYIKTFGPKDYSYNIGNVHVIIMDNVREKSVTTSPNPKYPNLYKWTYDGGFTKEQINWLKQDINLVEDKEEKMVLFGAHIPFLNINYGTFDRSNYEEIMPLFTAFKEAHLMTGHSHQMHNYIHSDYICVGGQPVYEHNWATACGCLWKSTFNPDGCPNGYGFFEIEGSSMNNWIYKCTGKDFGVQMRVYDGNDTYDARYNYHWYEVNYTGEDVIRGDPRFKDSFVVSLWDDDTENWTVEMYQGGVKIGDFQRVAAGEAVDVCTAAYMVKYVGTGSDNISSKAGHFWYYKPASCDPSSETDWEVVATQTIPTSGVVNVYRANTLQKDFTGFAKP